MIKTGWQVHKVMAELPEPASPLAFVAGLPDDWSGWLRATGVVPGTPFLVSPLYEFDVVLNGFFTSAEMLGAACNTQVGYARDLAAFLTFLWSACGGRSWREATEDDHTAYLVWCRWAEDGPRVDGSTWDREVAAVNRFYRWQVGAGNVRVNPIPQRKRRPAPVESGLGVNRLAGETPATYIAMARGARGSRGSRQRRIAFGGMLVCAATPRTGCPIGGFGVAGRGVTRGSAT